jgi:hypothetical protein
VNAETNDEHIIAELRQAVALAVNRLRASGARDEALAEFIPPRRVLLFTRNAVMAPIGRVWRLGVFLLDGQGNLYATGSLTRAVELGRSNFQSLSQEKRREYQAAAFRGPFPRRETVNFDAPLIGFDVPGLRSSTGPLFVLHGRALVRWNASASDDTAVEFGSYLGDRVSLLVNPPEGA